MSKIRLICEEKGIDYVNTGVCVGNYKYGDMFIRPRTKSAYIIGPDNMLEGK